MGSSSREKRQRKRSKKNALEKKKILQKKIEKIPDVDLLSVEQVKKIVKNPKARPTVSGKRKKRITKKLKHILNQKLLEKDVEMGETRKKDSQKPSAVPRLSNPVPMDQDGDVVME